MSSPPWSEVRRLFEQVLELPTAERAAPLAAADAAVRAEVQSLLDHHEADARFLDAPALPPPGSGARCGAWELVAPLGSGGMGDVYEARRADGSYDGRAAVKLLKRGMDSAAVLQRFAHERQALARLEHPHIARLLDAGLSDDGRPYFAMELVDGEPIDAAARALPLEARIALFLQLADAVAYAHRALLLHRDLKPGNVLVTRDGRVKLLDFGIARALQPGEADATLGPAAPFTPQYASPEQARGEPVGTATDVYSLGVLLYRLLTGQPPYGRDARTPQEAVRSVLEETPTRPSALAPDADAGADALRQRRRLRGDLDNILLKALDKDPARRYASVDALAADLRAYLAGLPVAARAPSLGYLAAKFVGRHRWAVGAATLGVAALLAAFGATLWQMQEAERARRSAEQRFADVRRLANTLVFRYHDQIASLPGATAVRAELLQDAQRYLDDLNRHVGSDLTLARELAETYFRLAVLQGEAFSPGLEQLDAAQANLDRAFALQALYVDAPGLELAALTAAADMWMAQASLATRRAQLAPGRRALERVGALAERARLRAPDDPRVLSLLGTLEGRLGLLIGGSAASASYGRVDEAKPHLDAARRRMQAFAAGAPDDAERVHQWAWACFIGANAAVLRGEDALALELAEESVRLRDRAAALLPASAHLRHQTAIARLALSVALSRLGRHDEALAQFDEAVRRVRATVDADASNRAAQRDLRVSGLTRGRLLWLAGRDREAREVLAATLAELPAPTLAEDFYLARARSEGLVWAARAWLNTDAAQALALADEAAAIVRDAPADDANASRLWTLAQAEGERGAALARAGRADEASAAATQALQTWQRAAPGAAVPGLYARWQARDRALAERR